jgi:HAE1 family hydrophobic/amphiphilic exporter-1
VITRQALGLPAMIGQLLLIGIVVANSILLVDTALRLRRGGMARNDALVESARLRVRPVLMTAVATIAALLPLAVGVSGEGGIISQSLGTVVIGGLLTATLLTLVIVPAVFTVFDRGRRGGPPAELAGEARPPATNGKTARSSEDGLTGGNGRRVGGTGAPAEA